MRNSHTLTTLAGKLAIAVCAIAGGASAFAATSWSNFNLSSGCGASPDNPILCGDSTLKLNGVSTGTLVNNVSTITTNFNTAKIYDWGTTAGLGVVAANEDPNLTGPHATDNANGIDAMLFTFSVASKMSSVQVGWNGTDNGTTTNSITYNDSDLSVFAYTGGGAPTMTNVGPSSLTSSGWTLIGNYADVGLLANNTINVATSVYSSYWLVSAYDTSYGGVNSSGVGSLGTASIDAFKVLAISAANCTGGTGGNCPPPNKAPEPGSLALVGMAAVGWAATRRKTSKAKA